MLYYRADCRLANAENLPTDKDETALFCRDINEKTCAACAPDYGFFILNIRNGAARLLGVINLDFALKRDARREVTRLLTDNGLRAQSIVIGEITQNEFIRTVRNSSRAGIFDALEGVHDAYGLKACAELQEEAETICAQPLTRARALRQAKDRLCADALCAEIERLFVPTGKEGFYGHPVHYIVETDEAEEADIVCALLHGALVGSKRLVSHRRLNWTFEPVFPPRRHSTNPEKVYESMRGGAVFVHCRPTEDEDLEFADPNELSERFLRVVERCRRDVLTVFVLHKGTPNTKRKIYDTLRQITFVEFSQTAVGAPAAKRYLRALATARGVTETRGLTVPLQREGKTYNTVELREIFEAWYDRRMKTAVFPQYAAQRNPVTESSPEPRGDAYRELGELIGLEQAKSVIYEAVAYCRMAKMSRRMGLTAEKPCMHMVFTGNPGTAKTTVARLVATILKDNGVLSVGDLHEVGRADLVGRFVGWTAKIVKERVRVAKGSVLFIDEAYALVDEKRGMFGDEAINTLVQEMENNREDTVIIFAGYTDPMKEFLERNPGLAGRVAFHVHFPDYNNEELFQITQLMLRRQNLTVDDKALAKIRAVIAAADRDGTFANGRFVRSMIERALFARASRLTALDPDEVTTRMLTTLIADDFRLPDSAKTAARPAIGFTATA